MFVLHDAGDKPIKVWLKDKSEIEEACLGQAINLARLPFAFRHVVLLPDCHMGYGMPIGGVLAAQGQIIPNAVGNDIGCGIVFARADVSAALLNDVKAGNDTLANRIVGDIMRAIPTGFNHQKNPQGSKVLDEFVPPEFSPAKGLHKEIDRAYYQLGTLGGGNHFIELQSDDKGRLCIMIHSGSRNLGLQICRSFNKIAREINAKESSPVPRQWQLAHLDVDSPPGKAYIHWMNMALEFAKENRHLMMERVRNIVAQNLAKYADLHVAFDFEINAHHNYAALERHFDTDVWVHRKGAIRAGLDEYGIIPGAMGSHSYIVKGKGNPKSFYSCSHGAGRAMSRSEALKRFEVQAVVEDLKAQNITLGKQKRADVAEESRWAYKDINEVISLQLDLMEPILRLKTVAVVKG